MKRVCLLLLFLSLKSDFFSLGINSLCQKNFSPDSVCLVIAVNPSDSNNITLITNKINSASGFKCMQYCKNLNVFIVKYIGDFTTDEQNCFLMLQAMIDNTTIYHKTGSVNEVIGYCNSLNSKIEPQTQIHVIK